MVEKKYTVNQKKHTHCFWVTYSFSLQKKNPLFKEKKQLVPNEDWTCSDPASLQELSFTLWVVLGFFQPPSTRETYADVKLDHLPHKSGKIDVIVFVENC